jgi:hypothetical protein
MADGHRDYSGTPLWKKLGIREGSRVYVAGSPAGFDDELARLAALPGEVEFLRRPTVGLDVAVVFAARQNDLERHFQRIKPALDVDGRLWVAWPKKASNAPTDITFASAQSVGLSSGMVDNKSASIDAIFQGLAFVYRVKDRRR